MKKNTIGGIIFLCLFLAGMAGAVICSYIEPLLSVVCIGAIFLSAGIFAIASTGISLQNFPLLLFPLVGAGMVVLPILQLYQDAHPGMRPIVTETLMVTLLLLLFLAVGVCLVIGGAGMRFYKQLFCNMPVEATCTDVIRRRTSKGKRVYIPNWTYYYEGQTYTYSGAGTNYNIPEVGEVREFLIHPDKPQMCFNKKDYTFIIMTIMGIIFIGVSLLALYAVHTGMMPV